MGVPSELITSVSAGKITVTQVKVIVICWVINMLDGFDVLAIAYAAPTISEEWSLVPGQLGIILSAGIVGMALGALCIAPLADHFGRRKIILWCLVVISASMLATAVVNTIPSLIIARIITGLGVGGLLASLSTMVAEYSPAGRRSFSISILQTGYSIGAMVGGMIAAPLIPAYGWQVVFIIGGVTTLSMIAVVLLWLPESLHFLIEKRPKNALQQVNIILARLKQDTITRLPELSEEATGSSMKELFSPALKHKTLLLWASFFMVMLTLYFLLLWTPQIIVNAGLPTDQGIIVGSMLNGGGLLGMLLLGFFSERFGLHRLIVIYFLLGAISMVGFVLIETSVVMLLVMATIIGFFIIGGMIGLYSVAAGQYPTVLRSTGLGWGIGIGRIGAILGPNIVGVLMGLGWEQSEYFLLLALPLIFATVSTYMLMETNHDKP